MDKRANLFATVYQQVLWYHQASSQYGKTQGFMVVFIPEYHAVRPQKPGIVVGAQSKN